MPNDTPTLGLRRRLLVYCLVAAPITVLIAPAVIKALGHRLFVVFDGVTALADTFGLEPRVGMIVTFALLLTIAQAMLALSIAYLCAVRMSRTGSPRLAPGRRAVIASVATGVVFIATAIALLVVDHFTDDLSYAMLSIIERLEFKHDEYPALLTWSLTVTLPAILLAIVGAGFAEHRYLESFERNDSE